MTFPITAPSHLSSEGDSANGTVSMVAHTATALTNMSIAAQDGDFLGAEADLLKLLGISRPTLRQAAKVVENDRLIVIRRGAGGGFYASRPSTRDAIQAPALYLKLHQATLEQMSAASRLIYPHAASLAAACEEPVLVAEMKAFRQELNEGVPGDKTGTWTVDMEVRLADLVSRMTEDPVIRLFMSISYSFGLLERRINLYRGELARRLLWLELQRRLCDAILAQDAQAAYRISRERGTLVGEWIQGGEKKRKSRTPRSAASRGDGSDLPAQT